MPGGNQFRNSRAERGSEHETGNMASVRMRASMGYLGVYLLAVVLGRTAVLENTGLALFWPAAGVAALWMLRGTERRQVALDATLLFTSTMVFFLLAGMGPLAASLFGAANLAQGLVVRGLSALLEQQAYADDLRPGIRTCRDLMELIACSVLAATVGSALGTAASWANTGSWTWLTVLGWVVRNSCGIVVVAAALLTFAGTRRERQNDTFIGLLTVEPRRGAVVELVAAVALSVVTLVLVLGVPQQLPIAYLLIATSAWIGLRFAPVVGALHSLGFGTLALLGTLAGWGAFGAIEDLALRAIVVQLFVAVTSAIVLMLSLAVTEKSVLNVRLRASEARATARAELLDAVTEAMTDGLCVTDSWGHVVLANSAAADLAGHDEHGHHAHDPSDQGFLWPDGSEIASEDLPHARALRGETVTTTDVVRHDPATGRETILSVSAVPLHHGERVVPTDPLEDPAGSESGPLAVVLLHDVTRERAEKRVLENFAGVVAHDLKGPLTGVLSWAELAHEQLEDSTELDLASVRGSVARIHDTAGRMNQLITDLLDYTLAGSAELHAGSIPLDELISSIARDLGLRGRAPLVEHAPLGRVLADALLTRQLFTNLIANSVKYVAPGVQPCLMIEAATVDGMREIRITDNGVGIPQKDRARVFDSFFRSSATGEYPGTGLGLAICLRAVERHGGRISAKAGPGGQGTTMVFTLPIDHSRSTGAGLPGLPGQDAQRVLRTTRADPPPRLTGSETAVT